MISLSCHCPSYHPRQESNHGAGATIRIGCGSKIPISKHKQRDVDCRGDKGLFGTVAWCQTRPRWRAFITALEEPLNPPYSSLSGRRHELQMHKFLVFTRPGLVYMLGKVHTHSFSCHVQLKCMPIFDQKLFQNGGGSAYPQLMSTRRSACGRCCRLQVELRSASVHHRIPPRC